MQDRDAIIEQAAAALESGAATPPDGQDPQAMADMLRTANERGGLGGFAAYKAAQRIIAERPRFIVDELGPRDFVVRDTVSQLSYDICFTRKVAQEAADRRNAKHHPAST